MAMGLDVSVFGPCCSCVQSALFVCSVCAACRRRRHWAYAAEVPRDFDDLMDRRQVRQLDTDLQFQGRRPTHRGQRRVACICCSVAQSCLLSVSVFPYLSVLLRAILAHPIAEGSQCNFTALSIPHRGRPSAVWERECSDIAQTVLSKRVCMIALNKTPR
jgi:hypothetical protein